MMKQTSARSFGAADALSLATSKGRIMERLEIAMEAITWSYRVPCRRCDTHGGIRSPSAGGESPFGD
jgi:hypothetical protein